MAYLSFPEALYFLQQLLDYQFNDATWLMEALHAGGPTVIGVRTITDANKRLALVGDSALQLVLVGDCFNVSASKGTTNNRLQNVACNANLERAGRTHDLERFIVLNPGTRVVSANTMASTVEAILGAVSKDSEGDLAAVKRGMAAFDLL